MERTPDIVSRALQPLPNQCGTVTLLPLTIGHALLLDRLATGALQRNGLAGLPLLRAVFILSRPSAATETLLEGGIAALEAAETDYAATLTGLDEPTLSRWLFAHVLAAFEAEAEVIFAEDGEVELIAGDGNGLGGILNLASAVVEMQLVRSHRELLATPVSVAIVLTTAGAIRRGATWADPTYVDRQERTDEKERGADSGEREDGGLTASRSSADAGGMPDCADQKRSAAPDAPDQCNSPRTK